MTGSPCASCRHYDTNPPVKDEDRCTAFPEGIPWFIVAGNNPHRAAVDGDHGIQWSPKPGFEYLDVPFEGQRTPKGAD